MDRVESSLARVFFRFSSSLFPTAHALWIDAARGELYCRCCGDYVYDADFDAAAMVRERWKKRRGPSRRKKKKKRSINTTHTHHHTPHT